MQYYRRVLKKVFDWTKMSVMVISFELNAITTLEQYVWLKMLLKPIFYSNVEISTFLRTKMMKDMDHYMPPLEKGS